MPGIPTLQQHLPHCTNFWLVHRLFRMVKISSDALFPKEHLSYTVAYVAFFLGQLCYIYRFCGSLSHIYFQFIVFLFYFGLYVVDSFDIPIIIVIIVFLPLLCVIATTPQPDTSKEFFFCILRCRQLRCHVIRERK